MIWLPSFWATSLIACLLLLIFSTVLPQGLCTFCSLCLECLFLRYLHCLLPYLPLLNCHLIGENFPYHPKKIPQHSLSIPLILLFLFSSYLKNTYFLSVTNTWDTRTYALQGQKSCVLFITVSPALLIVPGIFFITRKMMKAIILLPNLVSRSITWNVARGWGGKSGDCAPYWGMLHLTQAEFLENWWPKKHSNEYSIRIQVKQQNTGLPLANSELCSFWPPLLSLYSHPFPINVNVSLSDH